MADAYTHNLINLKKEDLPEEIRERFSSFCQRITALEAVGDEGSVAATMSQMSESDAGEMAREIALMADSVRAAVSNIRG